MTQEPRFHKRGDRVRLLWPPYCRDMSPCGQLDVQRDYVVVEILSGTLLAYGDPYNRVKVKLVESGETGYVDIKDLDEGETIMSILGLQAKIAQVNEFTKHAQELQNDYLEKLKAMASAKVKMEYADSQLKTHKTELLNKLLEGRYGI